MARTRWLVAWALMAPVAMLAVGWLVFYVGREPPASAGCMYEELSAAERVTVEAYRSGLGSLAAAGALVLGALIYGLARLRRDARAPGWPTLIALELAAVAVAVFNVENGLFERWALVAWLAGLFGGELVLVASAVAALLLCVLGRERPAATAALVYLWVSLLVVLPFAVALPASEGVDYLCLD